MTWHIEVITSNTSVEDSVLKISFGAGTTNHTKFGIIITMNKTTPHILKPILYSFIILSSSIPNFLFNSDLDNYTKSKCKSKEHPGWNKEFRLRNSSPAAVAPATFSLYAAV